MRGQSLFAAALLYAACSSDANRDPVALPPAITPLIGLASSSVLVVSSEAAVDAISVLSVDPATGEVGHLPGSPVDVGVRIGDVETLAADPARRRVFFGGNGQIAVFELDAAGTPVPVLGSPFPAERQGVSVIKVAPAGDTIYVGYHGQSLLSRYDVDAAGALALAQSISTGASSHVETMLLVGGVLYVGFMNSSNIVGFELDAQGAFTSNVIDDVPTNARPDFLLTVGDKLYCSLANDGSIDAFTIEADGTLTRLAGAPYRFAGIGAFELIAVQPGGARIAVGAETPSAAVGLYTVSADGTLTPAGTPLFLHGRKGGPEGLAFSADGRFLYVCDHVGQGLYVFTVTGDVLDFAPVPRYALPGRQIDVVRLDIAVSP